MFNNKRVVVTMTTYPQRDHCLNTALKSILSQKPVDEIVLNLSIDEYPKKNADLPVYLRSNGRSNKISINYLYGNTKAFKKLIPTLNQKKYQDCIVITCDDDCDYPDGIIDSALQMYSGDRPVCFNVPNTYNWGNGRLSIYEHKFFKDYLNVFERDDVWKTHNDDVAYGFLLSINGYKYEHRILEKYNAIKMLDKFNDMSTQGLYEPYKDYEFMKKYVLDRFGLNIADLNDKQRKIVLLHDTDKQKKNNINEIIK